MFSLAFIYVTSLSVDRYTATGKFVGSMGEVFEVIKKNLNISYEAIASVDGFYGGKVGSKISFIFNIIYVNNSFFFIQTSINAIQEELTFCTLMLYLKSILIKPLYITLK